MTYYRKLVGTKCYLSPVSEDDAHKWTEWLNDLEVTLPLGDEAYRTISLSQQIDDVVSTMKNGEHVFGIVDATTDRLIGRCLLFNVNLVDRNGMAGIFIGEKDLWSQGYGAEALSLLLDYAFHLLNLNNVMLGTFSFNARAIACYKKVGFREIGRRRQARIIGNRKFDVVMMDILAEEFQSVFVEKHLNSDE